MDIRHRPRRNRRTPALRNMISETHLGPEHFIYPLFLCEGNGQKIAIKSMPGQFRLSADNLLKEIAECQALGIQSFALFPAVNDSLKNSTADESFNPKGLLPTTVKMIKDKFPDTCIITDVALDPYSSDGHDGIVKNGQILNDETIEVLVKMAVTQAAAGADMVAPSDMMDGRVGEIRKALDQAGFTNTGILAYSAKYASSFYGPFRDALDSAPKFGDKKTYQMDPRNSREALLEAELDVQEGADMIMVKPALAYLDVIQLLKQNFSTPIAAYNVSGEYAMIKAAAQNGWLDGEKAMMESLMAIRRAGADVILTYFAKEAAQILRK
ncbi:porphobilinogen synthase [Bdellovibrio sp. HCB337]|uniref:porphobilinogen synthase n=1 Tax=Bdellovibrio sp. HCB337 TaxID=3394358 RepID=UPI0039A6950D